MCCGKNLYIVLMCCLQHHLPEGALYGVMDAVFRFVNQQEPAPAVGEGQSNTE